MKAVLIALPIGGLLWFALLSGVAYWMAP